MIQCDVNTLVYAFRDAAPEHVRYREWLEAALTAPEGFALSELVLSGFVRVMMQLRAQAPGLDMRQIMAFAETLTSVPNCVLVRPGPAQWEIFRSLCLAPGITAKRVSDAYHAATAIEHGHEWISDDADFGRFPGLRWRRPFD